MEKTTDFKIIKNERGNVTLLVKPVSVFFVDYLYEPYINSANKSSFFASGNVAITYKDLFPHLKEIVKILNEGRKPDQVEEYSLADIFSNQEDAFTLIKPSFDEQGVMKPNQYQINLSARKLKDFFLSGTPKENTPIPKDKALDYVYAMEIELVPGYSKDKDENYVFSVFHRAFVCGKSNASTKQNDDAWGGFDLEVDPEDLPF